MVVYNNVIHDIGDNAPTAAQNDFHGAKAGEHADNIWVLDNTIYNMGGDSVQMGTASTADVNRVKNIYIGRNTGYSNHENFVDIKEADDVIISSNVGYSMVPSSTSNGTCAVAHNLPSYVWFINNTFYDCVVGIVTTGSTNTYMIGNLLYDLHDVPPSTSGSCIQTRGSSPIVAVNNTCFDADNGIYSESGTNPVASRNNIVFNVNMSFYHHFIESSASQVGSSLANCLYGNLSAPAGARIRWGTSTVYDVAGFQTAFPGQGVGCMESDPRFVSPTAANPATANFRLQVGSPAIGQGSLDPVYAVFESRYGRSIAYDLDGIQRPQGQWDIGAYER